MPALRASEPVAQAPDLRVPGDAMPADQLMGRNLDLAATLAAHVDHFAPAEIIKGPACPIDVGAGHHLGLFGSTWNVTQSASAGRIWFTMLASIVCIAAARLACFPRSAVLIDADQLGG